MSEALLRPNGQSMAGTSYVDSVVVQMFEWPWASVEKECSFLSQAGYTYVQISPPTDHVQEPEWYSSYAPVSYELTSKRGDKDDLASMISTCNSEGIEVIVDVVVNHMTMTQGVSFSGAQFGKYSYPGYNPTNFHYCNGNGTARDISNWDNVTEVHICEFSGLADLAHEQSDVQTSIKTYLDGLLELGVSGFRVDSAMLIKNSYLHDILAGLSNTSELFITQEISASGNTTPSAETPETYYDNGIVHEFQAAYDLKRMFDLNTTSGLTAMLKPNPWGEAWGYTPSNLSNIFVTNHDSERYGGTLKWDSPNNSYALATYFMLGWSYATPTVFSGYNWTDASQPAPANSTTGVTDQVQCFENGWRCEHRWQGFANMANFRKKTAGQPVTYASGAGNQISFGRGNVGFLAINNDDQPWTTTFQSGMASGVNYCNIIESDLTGCSTPITVNRDGTFAMTLGPFEALALLDAAA
ncbi:MAG: hypothetical protein CYPHOPRED_002449 [Cyphobasidiales sp. Tagirdzhanova-0007]|nr:MAG: hypothetical protein CYPHOPRED_002449 [Cyphobasidiales sp. Tagirdzhanova-0007]